MTHTSPSDIVGKWKPVETRDDLDDPKSAKKGGRGEIIEFTADGRMRWPGERESRSKAYGAVLTPSPLTVNNVNDPPSFTLLTNAVSVRTNSAFEQGVIADQSPGPIRCRMPGVNP